MVFQIYVSDTRFKDSIDLLALIDDYKSHYVFIKDFDRFMFHKTKNKNKKWFCRSYLQCFSGENVLIKHKEDCLSINGKQSVDVEKGRSEFENYFKILLSYSKLTLIMLIYKMLKFMKVLTQKNIMNMFLVVMLIKLFVLTINLVSQLLFIGVKMLLMNLLKQFFKSINIAEK